MTIDEFIKANKPKGKMSSMKPYLQNLLRLKNAGYSLQQIQEYLKHEGVGVSRNTIFKYLKRNSGEVFKKPPALEGDKETVKSEVDKPKNITRFVDQDKLTKLKNHKRGDL